MAGLHAASTSRLEDIVADYATQRAHELIAQFDRWQAAPPIERQAGTVDWSTWIGQAAEILRELIRDA